MINYKFFYKNPVAFQEYLTKRELGDIQPEFIALYEKRKDLLEQLNNNRLTVKKYIGKVDNESLSAKRVLESVINELEVKLSKAEQDFYDFISHLPNVIDDSVVITKDFQIVKYVGNKPIFDFVPQSHEKLGKSLGILDIETAVNMSGTRFSCLKGKGAKLERALINFMLNTHAENGYEEILPPLLVKEQAMYGTGQLPKFKDDLFSTDRHYLIPTAEVSLTNLYANKVLNATEKVVAYTPCFRAEAGSYGRDTAGLIRQHQFNKVELVKVCAASESCAELESMLSDATKILDLLQLPYRIIQLGSLDLGFAAAKTYDIEIWLPSQNCYREISSVSNCTDFQSRRLNIKTNDKKLAHTLNGSGLAVGRTWLAILENCQNADGRIIIPNVLIPYTGFNII